MKTPMQDLIEQLKEKRDYYRANFGLNGASLTFHTAVMLAELMLEKEKEVIMDAYDIGWSDGNKGKDLNDLYYNETFNTKDK